MTTAILTDSRYAAHTYPGHVERAERLQAIEQALDASELRSDLLAIAPRAAQNEELTAVHDARYLQKVERFGAQGGGSLDPDTYMTPDSWEAALYAAGAAVRAVDAIMQGECNNAFSLARPPGHHATATQAMGFCLINNIAVAARHALGAFSLERVAIVDYDVHHGNGTHDIFYQEPRVFFCSAHAWPYYPGTGAINETGGGAGAGTTLNVPLSPGVGDKGYAQIFERVVIPALRRYQPRMIFVSAGYDAHWSDPIGPMVLSVNGYARLTQMLYDAAAELCDGRLLMVLEGGYNLDALGASVVAALRVLLGRDPGEDPLGPITAPGPDVTGVIATLEKRHPLFQ